MKKKKLAAGKLVSVLALTLMSAMLLTACGGDDEPAQETAQESVQDATANESDNTNKKKGNVETTKSAKDVFGSSKKSKQITIDDVANLNGLKVKDLNVVYDDDGFVTFLGNKFTDEKVTNEDEALALLGKVADLTGMGKSNLDFYRKDDSTMTGLSYYTFYQTDVAIVDGEEYPAKFYGNLIKLITDEKGNVEGLSAFLNHGGTDTYDDSAFLTSGDAEWIVNELFEGENHIYSDYTTFYYWDDIGTATDGAKVVPVWAVYVENKENNSKNPYMLILINALTEDYNNAPTYSDSVVTYMETGSLGELENYDGEYTSELFFAGMQDAGEYTYKINMKWAKSLNQGYKADDPLEVSVPVMYDPVDKLYYLADYKERIAVGNYNDFFNEDSLNAVVSDNPKDINSWHFASMKGENGEKYFFDPNYVISSYDALRKAYGCFKDRYGFNSVDKTGMPLLLCVYEFDEYAGYPTDANGFEFNATNAGQIRDWNVTTTSPATTMAVEIGTLTHEFTHGINGQMTNSCYANEQGAVMEGYADSIGELIAYLYGYKNEEFKWEVGSQVSNPIRSFDDPTRHYGAKYIGGQYYVSPVYSESIASDLDYGGVHTNSGVVNYLCYEFSNSELVDESSRLSLEENLDVWLETLYLTTYDSDFEDLAHYLRFAADKLPKLNQDKRDTVEYLTEVYGFTGKKEYLRKFIDEAGGYDYKLSLVFDDEDIANVFSFGSLVVPGDNDEEYFAAGEMDAQGRMSVRTAKAVNDPQWMLEIGYEEYYEITHVVYFLAANPGEELEVYVYYDECDTGSVLDTEGGMIYTCCLFSEDGIEYIDCSGDEAVELDYEGLYAISYIDSNGDNYLAMIEAE